MTPLQASLLFCGVLLLFYGITKFVSVVRGK